MKSDYEKHEQRQKVCCICGIIIGIIICLQGIFLTYDVIENGSSMRYTDSYTFGADFYTEQYTATMHAANNLANIGWLLTEFTSIFGGFIACIGASLVCYFTYKLADISKQAASRQKKEVPDSINDELPDL